MKPTDYWSTPAHIFSEIERLFGPFELDAAAWWRNFIQSYENGEWVTYPNVQVYPWPKRIKFDVPEGLLGKDGKPVKATTASWCNVVVIFHGVE